MSDFAFKMYHDATVVDLGKSKHLLKKQRLRQSLVITNEDAAVIFGTLLCNVFESTH